MIPPARSNANEFLGGTAVIARSEDAYFASDVVAVRVNWRLGWKVMRPERLAFLTTAAD